jgi:hypothetical protein
MTSPGIRMKMKIAFALIMFCYCVIIAKADDPTVNVEKDKIGRM